MRVARSTRRVAGTGLVYLVTTAAQSLPTGLTGDSLAGKALFEGSGGCRACHSTDGRGSTLGPDLSWVGILRSRESLRHALIDPGTAAHATSSTAKDLSPRDIDHLVAYLGTLKAIPPSEPRE